MQELTLLKTAIRRDSAGRFSLNDLHRAAGAEKTHQPSNWLRLDTTRRLIEEISESSDMRNKPVEAEAGRYGGTYVVKELVYAYAMWVSPTFHLAVIRAFDALVTGHAPAPAPVLANEHPLVAQFWGTYEALIERGERVNYSGQQGRIAIHLMTLVLAAWRCGLPIADRSKLGHLLKGSMQRPFIGHEDMFFGGRRIRKCWIFHDGSHSQQTGHAPSPRLAGAISTAPDIAFSQNRYELAEQCSDIALRVGAAAHALAGVGDALRKHAMEPHQAMTLLGSLLRDLGTHIDAADAAWH